MNGKISKEKEAKIRDLKSRIEEYFGQRTELWVEISALSDIEAIASKYARLKKDNYILENFFFGILLFLVLKGILNIDTKPGLLISGGLPFVSWGVCNLGRYKKMKRIQLSNPTVDFESFDFEESCAKRLALYFKTVEIDGLISKCTGEIEKLQSPAVKFVSNYESVIVGECKQAGYGADSKGHVKKLRIRRS